MLTLFSVGRFHDRPQDLDPRFWKPSRRKESWLEGCRSLNDGPGKDDRAYTLAPAYR